MAQIKTRSVGQVPSGDSLKAWGKAYEKTLGLTRVRLYETVLGLKVCGYRWTQGFGITQL